MSIRILHRLLFILLFVIPASGFSADVYIVFTANINGALQHCNCGDKPKGGIDRLKTFLQDFKSRHKNTIAIDGGDMMNSYPYPELNKTVLQAIRQIPYDVIVPGDQEFIEGDAFGELYQSVLKDKLLLSNSGFISTRERVFEYPDVRISISAILAPEIFTFIPLPKMLDLKEVDESHRADSFRVLVYHGRLDGLRSRLKNHPVDLVLLAHEQSEETVQIGQIPVAGLSRDAETVAVIKVSRRGGKVISDIDYHAINTELTSDPDISKLIEKFKAGQN